MKLLFTAPVDFDPKVADKFKKLMPTRFASIPTLDEEVEAWVCDPSAAYIINDGALDKVPNLKLLITPSTGTNHIDLGACAERGVTVKCLLDARIALEAISASSEYTFLMLLNAFRYPPAQELQGKRVGLVGLGRIGRRMLRWLKCFGCEVYYYDPGVDAYPDCSPISLRRLFAQMDAVVICCSLTDSTRRMIGKKLLESMKPAAVLVNTARGEILDEPALIEVLRARPDLRVSLDVVWGETTGTSDYKRLLEAGVRSLTPHVAGRTWESRTKAAEIAYGFLEAWRND